ncbi:zinc finger lsd1 subclass family protein (macronuclear) [Tetrahymena thermophila SB210]|uniref:Zinc finger lsd1 subclass family protein n=1 Tax=Tetrahymena thermophila (strain SB210) TaxID=312017 RepID=W7XDN1_TETTS|nr:zinc finger lsd1 subclass family protein [Tetrahymena thermophila SB210]EWS75692.1 zinc finger lsd1 subclass family protein [Tetrahymena thermophila SB210]|eukprot:XP_012651765.1 zinc finger lsd1 subclass family protein [Tetrahymena thermophila SB210]
MAVDQNTNKCQKCIQYCQNCDKNLQSCNKCQNGYFFLNNQCIPQCPDSYYGDIQNAVCVPCTQSYCKICNNSKNLCTQCKDNYFFDQNTQQCVNKCLNTQYAIQGFCKDCSSLFYQCDSCDQNQCNQCSGNFVLSVDQKQCLLNCPIGTVQIDQQCKKCYDNCASCDQKFICLKCNPGYYIKESEQICQPCSNSNCLTCDPGQPSKCKTCPDFGKNLLQNDDCVTQCTDGFFDSINNECKPCLDKCSLYQTQSKCINAPCPTGQYQGKNFYGGDACLQCSKLFDNCIECTSDKCSKCNPQKKLNTSNNTCNDSCPDNYYPKENICQQCPNQYCKTCTPSTCDSCFLNSQQPYLNENGNCVSKCENNEYLDENGLKCLACSSKYGLSCLMCNTQACIKCDKQQFISELQQNSCVPTCPSGQYGNTSTNLCQNCENTRCNTCDQQNPRQCLSCKTEYPYFNDHQCLSQCQEGYFSDELNQCQSCIVLVFVQIIIIPSNKIQKFAKNAKILIANNDCVENCDFYVNIATNECFDSCPNYLLQIENPKQCQECPQFIQSRTCVLQCSSNTYIDQTHKKLCVVCQDQYDNNCILCNSSKCLKCSPDFYLYQNKCYSQCPENTYFDIENYICLDNCNDPLVLIRHKQCSMICPSGYYKEPINSQNQIICSLCDQKCKECIKKSSFCTVCSQGSGWDCLDKEDFDTFLKNQYCEYFKEESQIEKCSKTLTQSRAQTYIIDITSYISNGICLTLILGNHTFIGVFSIYYIQIFQLIGNYVLIETQEFKIVNEVLTKYFLAFNTFNLIPYPFERENYSDLLTFFNYKTLILDIHNLSKFIFTELRQLWFRVICRNFFQLKVLKLICLEEYIGFFLS